LRWSRARTALTALLRRELAGMMGRTVFDPKRTLAVMPSLEPLFQLSGISVIIYSKLDRNKPCLIN
jgi:TctA family transporter